MYLAMVDLDDVRGEPLLELRQGQSRVALGIISAALGWVTERRARKGVDPGCEGAQEAFDVAAVMGLAHRPEAQRDAVVLTRLFEHGSMEFFGVITMNGIHDAPHRPRCGDVEPGEPNVLWQNGVSQAEPCRECSRRIEGNIEAGDHSAVHINRDRDPGPPDRTPVDVVDQFEIDRCVIDLDEPQGSIRTRKSALHRAEALSHLLSTLAAMNRHAFIDCRDAAPHRSRMRWREA